MSQYEDLDEPGLARSHSFQAHRRGVPAPPSLDFSDGGSSGSSSSSGDEQSPRIASANLKTAKPRNMAHHPHPTTTQDLIIPPSISAKLQSQPSPCFVHSHLADVAYTDIAKRKSPVSIEVPPVHETLAHLVEDPKDSKSPRTPTSRRPSNANAVESPGGQDEGSDGSLTEGESDDGSSLTRKLAETAVSVREMSKQLGRALVKTNVNSVLIITKARDNQLTRLTREMALWIMTQMKSGRERGVIVYVDAQLKKSKRFDAAGIERDYPNLFKPVLRRYSRRNSSTSLPNDSSELRRAPTSKSSRTLPSSPARGFTDQLDDQQGQLRYWTAEMCTKSPQLFDFVITLGGDGTVLFASWLFQRIVPPIIPFALGSLGFLTNFDYSQFRKVLNTVTQEGVRVNLRMRFTCTVFRAVETETKRRAVRSGKTGEIFMADLESGDWDVIESGGNTKRGSGDTDDKDREVLCFSTRPVEEFEVINDLVVDRGPSPYVSLLELFGDEHHMTTVQADGLCVATPTGSTAYSLSAGGSLVSPESPAILVTPICPHTLSFRPILLPDSMELRICVPYNSRSTAWASFDGRGRVELRQGDHIRVRASTFPFPTVCRDKQSTDWFHSIARTLKWNERQRQKSFVMVEEQRASEPDVQASKAALSVPAKDAKSSPLAREATDEDEPETFDIDDLSGTDSTTSAPDSPSELERPLQRKATDTSTADSITDDESRFSGAAPRPHPPKVSQRHSYQPPNGTSSTARDGETGDRDHILDRAPYVSKKKRIPKHLKLTPANGVSPPPTTGKRSEDLTKLERHRSETAPAHRRAFAIYGDDESDTSISDLSEG